MKRKRQVTIEDVANGAGVSTATVSRVLNGVKNKASAATRARVLQTVGELEYRPVRVGRALSMMQSPTVALLTPDTNNAFYASIADAVQTALNSTGKAMILCNTREQPALQDAYIEEMRSHLVSGIALLGAVPSPGLEHALADDIPFVFVNRRSPFPGANGFVGINNYAAGGDIARYFIGRGYNRLAAIRGPMTSSASRDRFEGFRDVLDAAGMTLAPDYICDSDLTIQSGYRQAAKLLVGRHRPRAIFCGNDPVAYGVYRLCGELGLRVPDDIALFGFDDNPLNEWLAPWLSTVHVPAVELGQRVAELLSGSRPSFDAQQITERLVPYRLIIRSSA